MEEEKYKIYINRNAGFFAVELENGKYRIQTDHCVFKTRDKLPKEFNRCAIVTCEEFQDEYAAIPGFSSMLDSTRWMIDSVRTYKELFEAMDSLKEAYKELEKEGWELECWANGEISLYLPLELKPFREEAPKDNIF